MEPKGQGTSTGLVAAAADYYDVVAVVVVVVVVDNIGVVVGYSLGGTAQRRGAAADAPS